MSEGSRDTGEFQDDLDARVDHLVRRGVELFRTGDLEGAVAEWEHALALKSDSDVARDYIEHARVRLDGEVTAEASPIPDVDDIPFDLAHSLPPELVPEQGPDLASEQGPEQVPDLASEPAPDLAIVEFVSDQRSADVVGTFEAGEPGAGHSSHGTLPGRPSPPRPGVPMVPRLPLPAPGLSPRPGPGPGVLRPGAPDPSVLDALTPDERLRLAASATRARLVPLPADDPPGLDDDRGAGASLTAEREHASEFTDHLPTRGDGLVALDTDDDVSAEFSGDASTGARTAQVQRGSLGFVRAAEPPRRPGPSGLSAGVRLGASAPVEPSHGDGDDTPTSERTPTRWRALGSGPSPSDPDAAFDFGGGVSDPFGFAAIELDQADVAATDAPVIVDQPVDTPDLDDGLHGGVSGAYRGEYRPGESGELLVAAVSAAAPSSSRAPATPPAASSSRPEGAPLERAVPSLDDTIAALSAEIDAGVPAGEAREARLRRRLDAFIKRALVERDDGHYTLAVTLVEMMFAEDPNSAITQKLIQRHRDAIADIYQRYLGDTDAVLSLAAPLSALPADQLDPRAAFLASRIDGMMSVDDLLDVSGMSRLETFRYLCRLMLRGLVTLG